MYETAALQGVRYGEKRDDRDHMTKEIDEFERLARPGEQNPRREIGAAIFGRFRRIVMKGRPEIGHDRGRLQ